MSNTQLEVSFVSVDSLPAFRSTHTRPSTSSSAASQVINLVDDDADTIAPPPAVRRRLAGTIPDDDDVIIVDPDTSAESSTSSRRISVGGAISRPIIIPDSDEEHSPTRNAPPGSSAQQYHHQHHHHHHHHQHHQQQQHHHHQRQQHQAANSFRIFSPPPPPPTYHPRPPVPPLPIIANPRPFAILAPPLGSEGTSAYRRLPFDEPPQPSTSSASAAVAAASASASTSTPRRGNNNRPNIQLGGGLVSQNIRPRRGGAHWHNNDAVRHNGPGSAFGNANANANANHRPPPIARYVATFLNHDPQHDAQQPQPQPQPQPRDEHDHQHADHAFRRFEANAWFNPRRVAGRTFESAFYFLSRNIIGTVAAAAAPSVPEYTKDMTHPGLPPPGWSFNFGTENIEAVDVDADDGDGGGAGGTSSATAPAEYLACASCLDPLQANVEERRDLSAEEKKKKRVWALRCGHMFDGKCIEDLMVPNWQKERPKPIITTATIVEDVEKKEEEEVKKVVVITDDEPVTIDKGKGKAKEDDQVAAVPSTMEATMEATAIEPVSTPVTIIEEIPSSSSQPESTSGGRYNFRTRRPPPPPQEQPTPPRSNRRNRAGATSASASTSTSGAGAGTSEEQPSRKPRGTKRKSDGKAVKNLNGRPPKSGIQHEWACPVAGCGKKHSSYKLQDVWKPDEENGPIAIYI